MDRIDDKSKLYVCSKVLPGCSFLSPGSSTVSQDTISSNLFSSQKQCLFLTQKHHHLFPDILSCFLSPSQRTSLLNRSSSGRPPLQDLARKHPAPATPSGPAASRTKARLKPREVRSGSGKGKGVQTGWEATGVERMLDSINEMREQFQPASWKLASCYCSYIVLLFHVHQ